MLYEVITTLSIISKVDFQELMQKSQIKNGLVEVQDFSIFSWIDTKNLEKIWPAWDYKDEVNKLITQFVKKSAKKTWTENLNLEEQKVALETEYT